MSKKIGNGYALYVTATDPSGGEGDIGSYDVVGFAKDHNFSRSRNMIDASDKDSGADSEFKPGRRTQTLDGTTNRDVADGNDAGQEALEAAYEADTEDASLLYFLLTNNVVGDTEYYGKAFVSQLDVSFPDEGMIETSFTFQCTDVVTRQAAAT